MNIIVRITSPLVIVGLALLGYKMLKASKQDPDPKEQIDIITSVDVITSKLAIHSTSVETFGTVRSKFETKMAAQVSGKIIKLSAEFRVGEPVAEGTILVTLDPTDYDAIHKQQQANLTIAKLSLDEEKIRAEQAKQDWKASGRDPATATDFLLRIPQLAAAQAAIDSTTAVIAKAEVDIERTEIIAPFDAIVSSRNVSKGDFATPQTILGSLIKSAQAEIYLPLTAEQNQLIKPNSKTEITLSSTESASSDTWSATFSRYAPKVDAKNQVSYLIATIEDPYGKNPLRVGSFVNASIPAKKIDKAYSVPESALVNDSYIWIVSDENKLVKTNAIRLHNYSDGSLLIRLDDQIIEEINVVSRPLSTFHNDMKVKIAQPK